MEEIDPCRWCGCKAKVYPHRSGSKTKREERYQVVCNKCRARGPIEWEERLAISTWNRGRCW